MAHLHIHGSPKDAFLLVWPHATQPGPAARLLVDQTGGFHSKKRSHLAPACSITDCTSHEMRCRKLGGGSDATSCVATLILASHFVTSVSLPTYLPRKRPAENPR